jgi:acetyltransferase-like isoleucine patch superfamily enzyme
VGNTFKSFQTLRRRLQGRRPHYAAGHLLWVSAKRPLLSIDGTMVLGKRVTWRSPRTRVWVTVAKGAKLTIGDRVLLNEGVNISCYRSISIGEDTQIADFVTIYDTNFHRVSPDTDVVIEPVVIGRNVWIGARTIVLPGVTVGDHSVIAAGSIVISDIPAKSVAVGVPAKVVSTFECPNDWRRS